MTQHVQTIDGQMITVREGPDGWPWVNGRRVHTICVPEVPHQALITLVLGEELFCLAYADYYRAVEGQSPLRTRPHGG